MNKDQLVSIQKWHLNWIKHMVNGPNSITIDLSALVHNFNQVKARVGSETKIMGVVKSDAYGHGLLPVSKTLERNKIDCLGVAYLHEALALRKNRIKIPIIILGGIQTKGDAREVVEHDLTPVIYDLTVAEFLAQESAKQKKQTAIHLKVDTGMGRLGIFCKETMSFIETLSKFDGLRLEALVSHLSSADMGGDNFTEIQIKRFNETIAAAQTLGVHLPFNSLSNSAGILSHKDARFEMVRTGISLYGGRPRPDFSDPISLRPVMGFKGRILQIRDFPDKTPVSYGRTYYTDGPLRVAILSAGYADGLPRSLSNSGNVLIGGKMARILGRVCMNQTIVDITGIKGVNPGDEAVFLGAQGDRTITGDDMAKSAGTISYEVFCSLGIGNKKEYLNERETE